MCQTDRTLQKLNGFVQKCHTHLKQRRFGVFVVAVYGWAGLGWTDGRVDGWTDGQVDGLTGG